MFKLNKIKFISNNISKINTFPLKKKSIKRVGNIPVNNSQNNTQYNSEKTPPIPLKRFNSYLMKKLMIAIEEESYKTKIYTVKKPKVLLPNNFKSIQVYLVSLDDFKKISNSKLEFQGILLLSIVSFFNYHSLIFPSIYLFPYLALLTFTAYYKYFNWKLNLKRVVYKLNLVDHKSVLLSFIDGSSDLVEIQQISLSRRTREVLILVSEDSMASISTLEVKISNNNDYYYAYFLLNETEKLGELVDIELLMAIVCQHTKYLNYV
jgi:hypothetical protein